MQVDGRATRIDMFARNALGAFAVTKVELTSANFHDRLLDPAVAPGTATPKADPTGNCTWLSPEGQQVFAQFGFAPVGLSAPDR